MKNIGKLLSKLPALFFWVMKNQELLQDAIDVFKELFEVIKGTVRPSNSHKKESSNTNSFDETKINNNQNYNQHPEVELYDHSGQSIQEKQRQLTKRDLRRERRQKRRENKN